ncbi:MAG: hypothetical protein JXA60_04795 [Candidatus Coatesbacteria bacterium]|nr:hypothetical protein [Candidatus Coatesbacteria bacterium]
MLFTNCNSNSSKSIRFKEFCVVILKPAEFSHVSDRKEILQIILKRIQDNLNQIPKTGNETRFPKADKNHEFIKPDSLLLLNEKTRIEKVSPHFMLKNFCEKTRSENKGILLDPALVLKMEILYLYIKKLNPAAGIYISSGYRSLKENYEIGNRTKFSMHQFGKAADIYICKESNPGRYFIDINGDEKINKKDRWMLMHLLWKIENEFPELCGYNQIYKRHVHTDIRGEEHPTMPKSLNKRKKIIKKDLQMKLNSLGGRNDIINDLKSVFKI